MRCYFCLIRVTSSPICWVTRLGVWEEECSEAVITIEWDSVLHTIITSILGIITSKGTSVTSPRLTTSYRTPLNMNRNCVNRGFLPPPLSRLMLSSIQAQVIMFILWFSASSPIRPRSKYEYERGARRGKCPALSPWSITQHSTAHTSFFSCHDC